MKIEKRKRPDCGTGQRGKGMIRQQDGSALISVMCVMMIMSALSLTLLKTSLDLAEHYERGVKKSQCELLALSVARVLQEQIEAEVYAETLYEEEMHEEEMHEEEVYEEWPVFYDLQDCGLPGRISLEMRETGDNGRLYVTVICEMDDVSKWVTNCYYPETTQDNQGWRWRLERME